LGNFYINQGTLGTPTIGGTQWWCPVGFGLWSDLVEINGVIVRLGDGSTATEPVICGNLFESATSTFMLAQEEFAIQVGVFAAQVDAAFVKATPPTGTGLITPDVTTIVTEALGVLAAAVITFNGAAAAFVGGVTASLSTSVFVSKLPLVPVPSATPSPYQL
jgi:hypothetical protein